jgi:enoyl-CoA hydratase
MNALDEVSEVGLTEVVRAAAVDAEVRALILLAEGKAFSAGGDFELMLRCNGDLVLYIVAHVGQVSW